MQTLETKDSAEARRCRIAQFSGASKTLKVGETSITGFVRSVREDKSGTPPTWIVKVSPARGWRIANPA
jgi:hypothetical protein